MPKFYGPVGYVEDVETGLDIHTEIPVERVYRGDLVKNVRNLENGLGLNKDVKISNRISIVADAYALNHMHAIRYVRWMGTDWEVTSVEVQPPRLILTLGGVYNGETEKDTE